MNGPVNGGRFPYAVDPGEAETDPPKIRPKSLRRLFAKGKHWRRADGTWVRVKDMHPAHRANAARMLLRKAAGYAEAVSWANLAVFRNAPDEVVDDAFREDAERSADPEKWMRSTKLYRRLVKGLPTEHAVEPVKLPEEDTVTVAPSVWTKVADGVVVVHQQPGPVELRVMVAQKPRDPVTAAAGRVALQTVLTVLEQWREGVRHNHDAGDHRDESSPCWDTFDVEDIRRMVRDAARQIGVTL